MPNYCHNVLVLKGDASAVASFFEKNKTPEANLSFEKSVPLPLSDQSNTSHALVMGLWGTKWEPMDVEYDEGCYQFYTAWDPPKAWLFAVAKKYPDLKFNLYAEEPMMDFKIEMTVQGEEVLNDETKSYYTNATPDDARLAIEEMNWNPTSEEGDTFGLQPDDVEDFVEDADLDDLCRDLKDDNEFQEDDLKDAIKPELMALIVNKLLKTRFPMPMLVFRATILFGTRVSTGGGGIDIDKKEKSTRGDSPLRILAPGLRLPAPHSAQIKRMIAEFAGVQFGSDWKRLEPFVTSTQERQREVSSRTEEKCHQGGP